MNRYCYCWLLWLLSYVCYAQPGQSIHLRPNAAFDEVPLQGRLYQLSDSTGQLSVEQVVIQQRLGLFRPSPGTTVRQDFGFNGTAVHWLFFEVEAPRNAREPVRLMLEIEYANLDELQLFEVSNGRITPASLTGDRYMFGQRPYQNNNYVFPLQLRPGQRTGYFLRLNQPHAILSFFIRLWHRPAFLASDRTEYFLWGIFIGIICIVLVLNMVMLVALRDRIYVWYSLYLHFITMHLFSDAGLGFQYLWPAFPRINEYLPVYLYVWAAMIAQTTFMQYFIRQSRHNSRVFWWVQGFKGLVAVALVGALAVQALDLPGRKQYMYQVVSLATSYFVPVLVLLSVISLFERAKQGDQDKMVRYYAYALVVQLTGYSLVGFMNYSQVQGWTLPFDVETYIVLGLTVLTDLIFFAFGLTYRYSYAQQHNQQLELNLLQTRQDAQQQVIRSLEDERQRLAQDLHDDVGPLLATAKGYLSRLNRMSPSVLLQQSQTLLDEAADELRTLSHQLLPKQLEQTSLVSAIAEATRKRAQRGVPIQFVSLGEVRALGRQQEQLLFSIATQLMRDAQTHAQATEIVVQLLYHEEQVTLSVEDDGRQAELSPSDAANLRAKVNLLRADLLIDAADSGNSVMISVPTLNPVVV